MTQWKKALAEGKLTEALEVLIENIKASPKDAALRSSFIELLCIDGNFERADEQLIQAIKLFPEYLSGASQLRHLVKAAQARKDFSLGAATAQFVGGNQTSNKLLVEFNLSLKNAEFIDAYNLANELEQQRVKKSYTQGSAIYDDVRDIDDQLGGYIELFSTAGNYFLVPIANIKLFEVKEPSSLLEQIWRPVEFDIEGLGEGEGHMPLTYIGSQTDAQKLGRETDWQQLGDQELFIGLGQKCWLVGEAALPIFDLKQLEESILMA
ncbi:type VI secretion system accessory protein TagJ [Vibrio hyugaensis]|uniref:type VI secretion system accessory protein TagJ n=1 Tax=Vibrio hyugaensis TaxID=1534743 RepID=UPI000CE47C44|nr:type VI secretion system accessory protein TagJ [Vibrio hyugaensis]